MAILRRPEVADLGQLHALIMKSTNGKSKITITSLEEDLFGTNANISSQLFDIDDPVIDLDISKIKSNRPTCQAFVAEVDKDLVAYIMFHYFYSPWVSHRFFIDCVYVEPGFRRRGFAKRLMEELTKLAKEENIPGLLFNQKDLNDELAELVNKKYEPQVNRSDKSDWSVFRIDFKQNS